jgi:hypothetical protein
LKQIDAKSAVATEADELRTKVTQAKRLLAEGERAQSEGDCATAKTAFAQALKLSSGLRRAEAGIAHCNKAAVPTTMDGP